jgi:hypothetical protein
MEGDTHPGRHFIFSNTAKSGRQPEKILHVKANQIQLFNQMLFNQMNFKKFSPNNQGFGCWRKFGGATMVV